MIAIPGANISELTQTEKYYTKNDSEEKYDPDTRIEDSNGEISTDESCIEYDPDTRVSPTDAHLNDESKDNDERTLDQGKLNDNNPDLEQIGDIDPMTVNQKDDSKCDEKNLDSANNDEDLDDKYESDNHRTPENNGHWDGERGDSKWIPDGDYTPKEKGADKPYSNPENQTWEKLLEKYGIDGITFNDGFPDFSEISKGTVEIDDFQTGKTEAKIKNFSQADRKLAEQRGCTPGEVKKWRQDNNYTWHECEDKKTMQKVPNEIHANIPHDGGRSQ